MSLPRGRFVRYAVALLVTGCALLLRMLLDPILGEGAPLTSVYCAMALVVGLLGLGPGLVSFVVGFLAADWLFIAPRHDIGAHDRAGWILVVSYAISGGLVVGLAEALRRGRLRAEGAHRRAEEEAALARSRLGELEALLDILPVAVVRGNADCSVITGNASAYEMSSIPPGTNLAVADQPAGGARFFHDGVEVATGDLPMYVAARTGRGVRGWQLEVVGAGDQRMTLLVSASPLLDDLGRVRGVIGAWTDITVRQRAEDELRLAASRLRLLWESASILMRTSRPDTMLQQMFAQLGPALGADAYLNYVLDEGSGSLKLASWAGVPEDVLPELESLELGHGICGKVAATRQGMIVCDLAASTDASTAVLRRAGFRCYACHPLVAGDRLLGTLSFASRSKDAWSPAELEFLQTITQHVGVAVERMRLIEQLRRADARKDEFLATLSHELRNPLAPLRNAAQLLAMIEVDNPDFVAARGVLDRQLRMLTRIVDDLLDVARITQGKMRLRKERTDLASIVRNAIEGSRPAIDAAEQRLSVEIPTEPVRLHVDPARLAQVLGNLLQNAAKYSDAGGVITLRAELDGGDVVIRVRDTGIGIASEHLPMLFEMFSQATPALERAQGGLGIGLALVKGLVELHGGTVEARSDGMGQGSEFVVRLGLDPAAHADDASSAASPRPLARGASKRILVVDDNVDAADGLALLLRRLGHEATSVHDGRSAIESVAQLKPDVVLLDIGLPDINGYEVARRVRAEPWGRGIELIALTGWGQDEDRRRSLEAGIDLHLIKPVELGALTRLFASGARN